MALKARFQALEKCNLHLPSGSEHIIDENWFRRNVMFLADGCKSGLNGRAKDESQCLEEWQEGDVSGPFMLVSRFWHIRSTSGINGGSNAHHETGQQHGIHASIIHLTQTWGDFKWDIRSSQHSLLCKYKYLYKSFWALVLCWEFFLWCRKLEGS